MFFFLRERIWIARLTSSTRPITGSFLPCGFCRQVNRILANRGSGLRPMTPDSTLIIGATPFPSSSSTPATAPWVDHVLRRPALVADLVTGRQPHDPPRRPRPGALRRHVLVAENTSLGRILQTYPQVIYHAEFNFEQVVYLKVDCSHNGSLKEICLNFFRSGQGSWYQLRKNLWS